MNRAVSWLLACFVMAGCAPTQAQTNATLGIAAGANPRNLCIFDLSSTRPCVTIGALDSIAHTFTIPAAAITGTISCALLPALTGAITTSVGSCATALSSINTAPVTPTGGTTARTLAAILGDTIDAAAFNVKCDNSTDDNTGIVAADAYAAANNKTLIFQAGTCLSSLPVGFTAQRVAFLGTVTLKYTGGATAYGFAIDGGASVNQFTFNRYFGYDNPPIIQADNATAGFMLRGVTQGSKIGVQVIGAQTYCIQVIFAVSIELKPICSGGVTAWTHQPTMGLFVTRRDVTEPTTLLSIQNPIMERITGSGASGTNGAGIVLDYCLYCLISGGTSESNAIGLNVTANSAHDTIINTDFESNTVADIYVYGYQNLFLNAQAATSVPAVSVDIFGNSNQFVSGLYRIIDVEASATGTQFLSTHFISSGGGAFTDVGTCTSYINMESDSGAGSALYGTHFCPPAIVGPTLLNSWANNGGGLRVAGYWRNNNSLVHFTGTIKSGAAGTVAFNVPIGYRPSGTIYFGCPNSVAATVADIISVAATGDVTIATAPATTGVSLDCVSFLAEQ